MLYAILLGVLGLGFAPHAHAQDLGNLGAEKPLGLAGSITLSGTEYQANGIPYRRSPFSWTISGSPVLSLYGVQMPFSFIFSEQERSFRQPFDQFGVSPTYKSITTHFGYRSMSFSHYSLAGMTFLGAGFEANPGVVRLAGMYGRLQRAINEDTTAGLNIQPAYERFGYAGKLGFGSDKNHFDLIYFHAKDDSNSVTRPFQFSQIYPQENAVFGINGLFTIIDPLVFTVDASASAITRDLRAPSFDSNKVPDFVSNFLDIKSSTSLATAGDAALVLRLPHFATRLAYRRIEPDYTSLGAYYFNTDLENYTLAPSCDLLAGKLRLGASVGLQHDDLLANKLARTSRVIGSGNVNWNPSRAFGIDAQYSNYSTDQAGGLRPVNDSIRVRNVSESASLAPRFSIIADDATQVVALVTTAQHYTDLNAFTNRFSNSTSYTAALSYLRAMAKTNRSIGGSLLFAMTQTSQVTTRMIGGSANGSIAMMQNKLTLAASIGYTASFMSSNDPAVKVASTGGTFNENINASWAMTTTDSWSLSIFANENSSSQFQPTPYQEGTATLSYTRSFSF